MTSFKEVLMQVADDFQMKLEDICFAVSTRDFDFPFSFFVDETDDFLIILVTDSEGFEKLHILVKDNVEYIRIHYLDEMSELFVDGNNEEYRNVRGHE